MPSLGAPIIASDSPGLDLDALLVAARRCFESCRELHRIVLLWEPPNLDPNGYPCGQHCETVWKTEVGLPITPRTGGITDAFKAAAWDFQETFGRALIDFCDPARTGAPSSWRIGRELTVWMFDDDDFRNDPTEYTDINGATLAASELHPVFVTPPSAHDLMRAVERLRIELPMVHRALFEQDQN